MSGIDWSKAPEGATHYLPINKKMKWDACWYRVDEEGQWFGWNASSFLGGQGSWVLDRDEVDVFPAYLVERPQPWTGDGLPPVGLTVRIPDEMAGGNAFLAQFEGLNVEIVGHATSQMGNPLAVFQYEDRKGDYRYHAMCGDNGNFEPIRTPEQIAADQRAKAVEKMWSIYWQPHATSAKQALGLLWDAGLRFADESDRG